MIEPLSLRKFAELLNVSHTAVRKAIEAGHIHPRAITYDARGHAKISDPDLAQKTWERSVLPYKRLKGMKMGPRPKVAQAPERHDSPEDRAIDRGAPPEEAEKVEEQATASLPDNVPAYARSRAIREAFAAQMARLEYQEKAGMLVPVAEVKVQWFNEARRVRDGLLNVPARIVEQVAALCGELSPEKRHEMLLLLQQEVNQVLTELSDGAR